MQRHELKTWPRQFCAILAGSKKYELRVNDRNFQEGDELMLQEWDPDTGRYTGRHILAAISYMTRGGQFGLPSNLVVMSLQIQYWNTSGAA